MAFQTLLVNLSLSRLRCCATIRNHHISVLVETRTDDMDKLTRHLQGAHKLVHRLDAPAGCAGRRGHGVAIIASNA
eukprot:400251-Pelagomonas_calceolata.AAC.1